MNRFENKRLAMELRRGHRSVALEFPCEDIGEILIVAKRFAIGRLVLLAAMSAAGFVAGERVDSHELGELEEIGDASGALE